uniref:ELL-associated factor 1 n=1 Tax=Anthurium amnicola TaxID=1678845 RepID=A0A1D1Z1I0_9ARAE
MASNSAGGEPSTAPQPDRWYTLRLGSSFKEDRPSSKFCTLRYEFKPASIDKSQPGSLHKNKENRITVEFHNNQVGKPKVTFEGSSEDCKDNDGVLFFDGETFRLERLHRAVKRLRHVRQPGESVAASGSSAVSSVGSVALGADSRSPPPGKMSRPQPLSKSMVHSVPLEVERIDIGGPNSPVSKPTGKSMDKDNLSVLPNPSQASPDKKPYEPENVDIDVDDDNAMPDKSTADGQVSTLGLNINLPNQNDTDDEIADVDVLNDDRDKVPNAAEAPGAQVNTEEEQQTSSSSGSSESGSSSSGSGSGSSSSDSEGSDDDSASSGGDIDIEGEL